MFMKKKIIILFCAAFILIINSLAWGLLDNWGHWNNGLKYLKQKNYGQAMNNFDYWLKQPDMHRHMFGIAYFGRGLVYQATGNYNRAITEYKMAIQNDLHPTVKITYKAYMNIGTIRMENKAYQAAVIAYMKAVKEKPKSGLAHYYLGLALLKIGEYEKAEEESEKARELGITFTALSDKLSKIKTNSPKTNNNTAE